MAEGCRRVPYTDARAFLERCRSRPERMRVLCSTKASRDGGDQLAVTVEVAPGGPEVEVREVCMAEGWTGCRFSPAALWLALELAHEGRVGEGACGGLEALDDPKGSLRPRALELGCGVALVGLTAHALGFETTLTDCLPGHLRSLSVHCGAGSATPRPDLRVRRLDWLEEEGSGSCSVDTGSPENVGAATTEWPGLGPEERQSFDLVVASDVLYEEHHAVLLPAVVARWLKPGGAWAFSFAIRDAPMLVRFLEGMRAHGLLLDHAGSATWETACSPGRCTYCRGRMDDCGGREDAPLFTRLRELVEGHEGGAVLIRGRRPR